MAKARALPEGLPAAVFTPPPVQPPVLDAPAPPVRLPVRLPASGGAPAFQPPQSAAVPSAPGPASVAAIPPVAAASHTNPGIPAPAAELPRQPLGQPVVQPQMQGLFWQMLGAQRTEGQAFHLVHIPVDRAPLLESFLECQALISRMTQLLGTPCYLFAFLGHALPVTGGPLRHLATPWGYLPLFQMPTAAEMAPARHGWVGQAQTPEEQQAELQQRNPEAAPSEALLETQGLGGLDASDETPMFGDDDEPDVFGDALR